jgi:hypothetical protein
MIVRDELPLIEKNIEFHAKQGVDHFVVMDNTSVDSTREAFSIHDLQRFAPGRGRRT